MATQTEREKVLQGSHGQALYVFASVYRFRRQLIPSMRPDADYKSVETRAKL